MKKSEYLLEPAEIVWNDQNPSSRQYGDIYGQENNFIQEKLNVFIDPFTKFVKDLPSNSQVTVCELGLGFGINLLLAADFWSNMPESSRLNFISVEKHPVSATDLKKMLRILKADSKHQFFSNYPINFKGHHTIWIKKNVKVLIVLDDVASALSNLDANVDFWFLDGFSPAKNECMWDNQVFKKIRMLSRPGAQALTYSSAGKVKLGLERNGFKTKKKPGFGKKNEMLIGFLDEKWLPATITKTDFTIIGAGLAGLFCAEALTRRNIEPTIIDMGTPGPSFIPQLSVFPLVAKTAEPQYRMSLAASEYMGSAPGFFRTGLTSVPNTGKEQKRLREICDLLPDSLMVEAKKNHFYFPRAGWFSTATFEKKLNLEKKIYNITKLRSDSCWNGYSGNEKVFSSQNLILATGSNLELLPDQLEIRKIKGQAISVDTFGLNSITNGLVTVFPTVKGKSVVSGTYENSSSLQISPKNTKVLLEHAETVLGKSLQTREEWVGLRASSRDRIPIVGQAPKWAALQKTQRVRDIKIFEPGLHYCLAFGSRGATHARLFSEHLISKVLGEPCALGKIEQAVLSPARFFIRDQVRCSSIKTSGT